MFYNYNVNQKKFLKHLHNFIGEHSNKHSASRGYLPQNNSGMVLRRKPSKISNKVMKVKPHEKMFTKVHQENNATQGLSFLKPIRIPVIKKYFLTLYLPF